ncbi:Spermidine/putrescine transport system permease protein PotB [Paenibacillus sp. P1XP2]|nr:Spermidine/putrescine transport system permease protein PotB [Paenibacillus sp. P1XP2]
MKKRYLYVLLAPGLLFLTLFMIVPLILTVGSTFFKDGGFTAGIYAQFFKDAYFLDILGTTLLVSVMTTLLCIVIGFPVAYYLSKLPPRKKGIMLALAIFPLLTSSVVRSFSWMIILAKTAW